MSSGATERGHSYLQAYRDCPRKFYLRYKMKLEPQKRILPLSIGTLVHKGLEHLQSKGLEGAVSAMNQEYETMVARTPEEDHQVLKEMPELLLRGYAHAYGEDKMVTVLSPEHEFSVDIKDEQTGRLYKYTGKIDKIVTINSLYFVKEHKTSGLNPSAFLAKFSVDHQITGYYLGASTLNLPAPISGIVVDAIFKPRVTKGKIGQLNENSFQREGFFRSQKDIEVFIKNVIEWNKAIDLRGDNIEEWPQNTGSCFSVFGTPCMYLDLCKNHMDPRVIEALYQTVEEEPNGISED